MQIFIDSLNSEKIDNLICADMDTYATSVAHTDEHDSSFVPVMDILINSVQSIVVTNETVTFLFDNQHMFCAELRSDDYHKIEVL